MNKKKIKQIRYRIHNMKYFINPALFLKEGDEQFSDVEEDELDFKMW